MNGNVSLMERFEALMRNYEDIQDQNDYLSKYLARAMKMRRKNFHVTPSSNLSKSTHQEEKRKATLLLHQVRKNVEG